MRRVILICLLMLSFLSGRAYGASFTNDSDTLKPGRLRAVVISQSVFYITGVSFLQFIWYKDHEKVPFHYYNDNKGWLQLDKAGHAYSAYYQSYLSYKAFRWAGVNEARSIIFGSLTGILIQTPIEIFDGLYEGYGFSTGDIIANTAGVALFAGQEAIFHDQIARFKFSYSPSRYTQYRPAKLGESHVQRFFMDYNGHTYWISVNARKVTGIKKIPGWLAVSFGYSGNGMLGEFTNPIYYKGKPFPYFERYRQYLLSLDIDLSKIETKHKGLKVLFNSLNLIKIPFPTLEYNRPKGWKLHALYF